MARDYWAAFGGGSLGAKSGLSPTFITFINGFGSGIAAPAITEPASKGLYKFSYDTTQTIAFVLDGATTGLASGDRFVSGTIEAQDNFGITLSAVSVSLLAMGVSATARGATLLGIGNTTAAYGSLIGGTLSSFGSTSSDPVDMFGMMKRFQELLEGNQVYTKATGILDFYSRGSSTLLREKTVSDTSTSTTKT